MSEEGGGVTKPSQKHSQQVSGLRSVPAWVPAGARREVSGQVRMPCLVGKGGIVPDALGWKPRRIQAQDCAMTSA